MAISRFIVVGALAFSMGCAQAALHDRGGGLLYDDALNITWLQDANYAKTSGYDADGRMQWSAANTWASRLSISRTAGESLTGWRLPTARSQNVSGPCSGYYCIGSEMGHMFYNNLGASGDSSILSGTNTTNLALLTNLQSDVYWLGTEFALEPSRYAWIFFTSFGVQNHFGYQGIDEFYAWAVRDGDVAAVPEPEAYAMFFAGLGLLGFMAKRRRRSGDVS